MELQVDFGRMGLLPDPGSGRHRVCHALIFTACYSRHCFVWLTFRQTTAAVIAGCEAAWVFFGGVFAAVVPDNMATIVDRAGATEPRFNQAFVECAQSRGFLVDPARVRRPTDKPRVERDLRSCVARRDSPGARQAERRAGLGHAGRTLPSGLPSEARLAMNVRTESPGPMGGQGRGRTADLPLFRRTLVPTELPAPTGAAPAGRPRGAAAPGHRTGSQVTPVRVINQG